MNKIILLERMKAFCEEQTRDLILPVSLQKGDAARQQRAAEVHSMRLPDGKAATKKAPYILNQIITGKDAQPHGEECASSAVMRSIFCVYDDDEEEGSLRLLTLMERVRIGLLKTVVIGGQFEVDLQSGIEYLIYPDDTAPYYAGEMVTTWKIPPIKREVPVLWGGNGR